MIKYKSFLSKDILGVAIFPCTLVIALIDGLVKGVSSGAVKSDLCGALVKITEDITPKIKKAIIKSTN